MASQLLAADASIPTTSFRLGLQTKLSAHSSYLHPGNSFSYSSSSYSGYGGQEARAFCVSKATRVPFVGQETRALFIGGKDSSIYRQGWWCLGGDIVRASHQQTRVSHSKKESRVCHGFGLHHECASARCLHGCDNHTQTISRQCEDRYRNGFLSSSWKASCLPHRQSSIELRIYLQRRNFNACRCFLPNFLKKGYFVTESDEKQRQRDRQHALLSLCAEAMVASQMGQSTLLSFLWTNWPSMVDELCGGGQGGGNKNNASNSQAREPDNASIFQPCWRVLLLGFICGSVIALAINSSMSVGALLDACLWLCLLCSLLFLAAYVVRILCSTVMFMSRGGLTALPNSCAQALQKWVLTSFCQGFFAGISTLLACVFWLNRGSKPRASKASSSVSSLWSRLSTKIEGKRVGSTTRGGFRQVCSKRFEFLQYMLPKQAKL